MGTLAAVPALDLHQRGHFSGSFWLFPRALGGANRERTCQTRWPPRVSAAAGLSRALHPATPADSHRDVLSCLLEVAARVPLPLPARTVSPETLGYCLLCDLSSLKV